MFGDAALRDLRRSDFGRETDRSTGSVRSAVTVPVLADHEARGASWCSWAASLGTAERRRAPYPTSLDVALHEASLPAGERPTHIAQESPCNGEMHGGATSLRENFRFSFEHAARGRPHARRVEAPATVQKRATPWDKKREEPFPSAGPPIHTQEFVAMDLATRPDTVPTEDLLGAAIGRRAARSLHRQGVSLRDMRRRGVAELVAEYNLTETAARKVVAVSELAVRHASEPLQPGHTLLSSKSVYEHFGPRLRDLEVEQFHVLLLDGKHRMMSAHLISQGTLTSSPVHPREVFRPAIRAAAAAIVLVHNHPSGQPNPSADDLEITRRLVEVGELVGIRVLDHVICGWDTFVSLADRGLMT